jgi:hypothetical protein
MTLLAVSVVLLQLTLPFVGVPYVVIFNVEYIFIGFCLVSFYLRVHSKSHWHSLVM